MNERPSAWRLALTFSQIALASFGGGLSAWSHEVVVRRRGWLDEEEFLGATTLCRVLPGANQVNLAVYVGAKLDGVRGAVASVLGLLALPVPIVLGLAWLYGRYGELPALQAVLRGAVCVAVAMTFAMVWQTGRKCLRSPPAWALFLACVALSGGLRVSLPLVLLVLAPPALWWGRRSAAHPP